MKKVYTLIDGDGLVIDAQEFATAHQAYEYAKSKDLVSDGKQKVFIYESIEIVS